MLVGYLCNYLAVAFVFAGISCGYFGLGWRLGWGWFDVVLSDCVIVSFVLIDKLIADCFLFGLCCLFFCCDLILFVILSCCVWVFG